MELEEFESKNFIKEASPNGNGKEKSSKEKSSSQEKSGKESSKEKSS